MAGLFGCVFFLAAAEPAPGWPTLAVASPRGVDLTGPLGESLQRGVDRLAMDPYTADWLMADVYFKIARIFTNYSGDVSGRFLELAVLTRPPGQLSPATLSHALATVANYQRPDGHFGVSVDLNKPLAKNSPPIPMLWGNARLLVGLVTAARELNDPQLLAAAKRLGDFYVTTASQLCAAQREADYRSSGTYGDGYACCYFPAMEGLAMLYRATKDGRYLQQARRMAEMFWKFDGLPIEHSHGNLCAWRSVLGLYDLTGERDYLNRARAKWDAAVQGGYVWPLGGVGEHWQVFFNGDEGCSESDWLRFNLDLWRFTGETRYLDMAERLLENQYAANQCASGEFGMRRLDGDANGPVGTSGAVEEWPFCCSFHGPLGLHFLKAYLAAGSERDLYVNFPASFAAPVQAGGTEWRLAVKTKSDFTKGAAPMELDFAPQKKTKPVTLWLRVPSWASDLRVTVGNGAATPVTAERGYVALQRDAEAKERFTVSFHSEIAVEGRRFQPLHAQAGKISRFNDVLLVAGPKVLSAAVAAGRANLLAMVDGAGCLELLRDANGGFASVSLPTQNAHEAKILATLETGRPVTLQPWSPGSTRRRTAFAHNLVVVPAELISPAARARFAERAGAAVALSGPFYGTNLEAQPDLWQSANGWKFTPDGLLVAGGDIGLLEGEGYEDYRFEFDLQLPKEGQGITGWIVRARSANELVMFQLQSADSPLHAPEFKTKPNTLRPHLRRNWSRVIADPVPLPKEIRRGETHQVAVECRGARIEVFLDGKKIHSEDDGGSGSGTVGFRAAGPAEQGLFRNISLRKLSK